ncbi:MAG: CpsD/CapB family tyrosine-protein kinase [Candidatus Thiodiazotropha sp.]
MEKIKKALERARDLSNGVLTEVRQTKPICQSSGFVDLTDIKYTSTKTIEISNEVLREKRILSGITSDPIIDHYNVLRTQVLQRLKPNQWNLLAVTSPNEGCGKTITAINLAISIAREVNHSVLLIDMDLRNPSIRQYFVDERLPGISDYVNEDKELSEILFNPGLDKIVILPGNRPINNSSEMLSSPKVVKLVQELKNRYQNRIVIFDMPPLLSCDDVIAFSPYIDAVMLVVSEGSTLKKELVRSCELVSKLNVIGTVINKSKAVVL